LPNVERMEFMFPILYLYRREGMDTGGPGMYRGGTADEWAITPHDARQGKIDLVGYGFGNEAAIGPGIYGGYPAATWQNAVVSGSDINERIREGNVPRNLKELKGTHKVMRAQFTTDFHTNDVFYIHECGGGGYGDPIDREPDLVLKDVINKRVSLKAAKRIYGVIIDLQNLQVDQKKTDQERNLIRNTRRKTSKKVGG